MKRQPVSMSVYQLKIGKIIKLYEHKPIQECLIAMLEEANKYHIVDANKKVVRKGVKKMTRKERRKLSKLQPIICKDI